MLEGATQARHFRLLVLLLFFLHRHVAGRQPIDMLSENPM
jgi:hypothetical protein